MPTNVADWLRRVGLEQYAPAFAANDIDAEVLPELTVDDLIGLGIASIGHRRKLLAAIAALRAADAPPDLTPRAGPSGSPVPNPPPRAGEGNDHNPPPRAGEGNDYNPPPQAGEGRVGAEAERRQLTAMFCDLVGSTPLSTRFDPEDLREIVGAYHRCVADTVGRFGGFVAKYMGDGVLVYFGYPEAHEDDAERAARAGLAVIDAVGRLATPEPLNVRIGIATGLVVVGDLIGAGAAQERGVVGETPNLAARLQALAQPGTLVIAQSTRQQIGTLFEIEDLGPQPLAGFAEPQRAWRVVGESGVASRFEALRSGTTPLIGRDEELDLLLRRWQQAKSGEGRVVLVSGEPGIGKSRLTAALSAHIESEPHTRLRYFCSPHHQDSALYPFIGQLERATGFARDDTATMKLDKLDALLGDGAEPGDISLIAEMLSLSGGERFPPLDLSPQRKKERTLAALLRQLQALARQQPILMIFEDLHWIDPTSREVLDLTVERIAELPVLLVATYRPEFQPPWVGGSQVTVVALNRLGRNEGATLVHQLAGNLGALPPDIVDEIVERTDGVPLFVEELTKAVVEAGADRGYASISAVPRSSLAVPATLHASLLGRLDRLGPAAKTVAQAGAAIGRDFSYELLAAVASLAEPELQEALRRLVEAGLVFQRGVPPAAEYLFKHALVQDTAYSTLLRGPRQALHRRIAEALDQRFPDIVETEPETLAYHLTEAGLPEQAAGYWLRAGKIAIGRYANIEAIAHLRRGIEAVSGFPDGATKDRLELDLQFALGPCVMATQGPVSNPYAAAVTRARELCERLGDAPEYPHVMHWATVMHAIRGELPESLDASTAVVGLAEAAGNRPAAVNAMRGSGVVLLAMGRLAEARRMMERNLAEFEMCNETESLATRAQGQDAGVAGMAVLGWTLWALGYPDMATARVGAALQRAEAIGHPHTQAYAAYYASVLYAFCCEPSVARTQTEHCLVLSEDHGFDHWRNLSRAVRGICANQLDSSSNSLVTVSSELAEFVGTGYQFFITVLYALLSQALLTKHQLAPAREIISKGLATAKRTSERFFEAEFLRLKARGLVIEGRPDALTGAQKLLEEALAIAQSQNARSLELRAATDLARLWRNEGRLTEARELLAPLYGWFTEGFDTADLKEPKALLDELA